MLAFQDRVAVSTRLLAVRTLTDSQIRHIKLAQLNLLSVAEVAPAHVVCNACAGRDCSLNCVDQEMNGDSWIVWFDCQQGSTSQLCPAES